ncbi:MAG TPA: phosphatidylserine decarboxylase family protein [Planctomycetes bacterium]|nr:phosphatidylserine decarboxylase family protein [Planctomycetota bacterium]
MRLAAYGRNVITAVALMCAGFAGAILLAGGGWWGLVPILPFAFTLFFFRDPERWTPEGNVVVSAADGKVTAVEETEEAEYLGGRAMRISVFLSIFDVHLNRSPVDGTVEYVKHYDGRFLNAMKARSAAENERTCVGIATPIGKVLIVQIAGAIARRIKCGVKPGDALSRGQRFGMIMFGSRTDVYLPADKVSITVKPGDTVRAGMSVIAEITNG